MLRLVNTSSRELTFPAILAVDVLCLPISSLLSGSDVYLKREVEPHQTARGCRISLR
jgi:hypothetical protein